jgi:hypothetical protein
MKQIIWPFLVLALTACTTQPVSTPSPTPVPPTMEGPALPWKNAKWTEHLNAALSLHGKALVESKPADRVMWCPNYDKLTEDQRRGFYAVMIAEASRWESEWNPTLDTYECRKNSCVYEGGCQYVSGRGYCMKGGHALDGGLVVSRGLMQMSLASAQGIGCDLKVPIDLHDPAKNLVCTVKAFNRYIVNGGQIATKVGSSWKGAAAYFAVFRGTTEYTSKSRAAIMAAGTKSEGCL